MDSFHQFEFADYQPETGAVLRGEFGFCPLLGRHELLNEFSAGELTQAVERERPMLHALVREGKFPRPLATMMTAIYEAGSEARPHEKASVQVFAAHVLCRLDDPVGAEAMLFYLGKASPPYRRIALLCLSFCRDESISPLDGSLVQALRACTEYSDQDALLVGHAAEWLQLKQLVPDLLAARQRAAGDAAQKLTRSVLCTTSDRALTDELLGAAMPTLAHDELIVWVRDLRWEIVRNWTSNGRERLRPWARAMLDRWLERASTADLATFAEKHSHAWQELLEAKDKPFLERVVAAVNQDPAAYDSYAKYMAEKLLACIDPDKRLEHLFGPSRPFETVMGEIAGSVQRPEIEPIVAAARKALRGKEKERERHPFDYCSASVLWVDCGEAGRKFLLKHLDACTTTGLRTLVWLAEELSAEAAAEALVQAGLSHLSTVELRERLEQQPRASPLWRRGPQSALAHFEAASRYHQFSDSEQYPPDYDCLLEQLCRATAGAVILESATVESVNPDDFNAPIHVQFRVSGRTWEFDAENYGSAYDTERLLETLTHALADLGTDQRFHQVSGDEPCYEVIFGPPAAVQEYANQFAIPLSRPEGSDPFREQCMARIKQAAKKRTSQSSG